MHKIDSKELDVVTKAAAVARDKLLQEAENSVIEERLKSILNQPRMRVMRDHLNRMRQK